MKCASVAIIGRPSSGKSTLLNTICESKVSITSPTPHTTRNAIRGIYTDSRGQLIFTDTPGYHLSEKKFNKKMQDIAVSSLEETDAVLYMMDATRKPGDEEDSITYMLSGLTVPVVCCINKKDILSDKQIEEAQEYLKRSMPGRVVLVASAKADEGVDEILIELFKHAPEGELLYDENTWTDQDLEFRVSEIIREKAMNSVTAEIPYAIMVEVSDLEYNAEEGKVWIRAFITVERESQKGIMVGKGGENIKKIRIASFKEIKKIFPGSKLELDLRVRVNGKWKSNDMILSKVFKDTQS
ncbi:MAG TPA: GTPase Era [Sphaerochaeta sp.]|jgi:GTP-binding protein Era|nr:GTPase Era [Sphaerochaeta sp.]